MTQTLDDLVPEAKPDDSSSAVAGRESPFERLADYVSAAMGRPPNILAWFVFVFGWTVIFAVGGPKVDSGSWLPSWFTSQGFNFPLNLITTVAELFIGFLVAAASNRSERNLDATLAKIELVEDNIVALIGEMKTMLGGNTELTGQVHELTQQVHLAVCGSGGGTGTPQSALQWAVVRYAAQTREKM